MRRRTHLLPVSGIAALLVLFFLLLRLANPPATRPGPAPPRRESKIGEGLAPYLSTPISIVDEMMKMADVRSTDVVYDLGCGDGRIVVWAAERYGARGVGVDYDPICIRDAHRRVKEHGVEDKVRIIHGDIMEIDFSSATVVTIYLLPESNARLQPRLEQLLPVGARVVSHQFDMPLPWRAADRKHVVDEKGEQHVLYMWRITPAMKERLAWPGPENVPTLPSPRPPRAPRPVPAADGVDVETHAGLNLELVWIPPGVFEMGSRLTPAAVAERYGGEPDWYADEHPLHGVELDGFWLGRYEVTNAQFRKFRPDHSSGQVQGLSLDDDRQPVVNVSWDDAVAFCQWLSNGTTGSYTLPTEAQWEYACRAHTQTTRYWGDDDTSTGLYANVADQTAYKVLRLDWAAKMTDGHAVSAPVGSFVPNGFGLYDMLGNVSELCLDWYRDDYYQASPRRNPPGPEMAPEHAASRVFRGGSWCYPQNVRAAYRSAAPPTKAMNLVGFRVCRRP